MNYFAVHSYHVKSLQLHTHDMDGPKSPAAAAGSSQSTTSACYTLLLACDGKEHCDSDAVTDVESSSDSCFSNSESEI